MATRLSKREIIRLTIAHQKPPYVPWSLAFTREAREKLVAHHGRHDLEPVLHNHLVWVGDGLSRFQNVGNDCVRDAFGVVWDRSVDKDIGVVRGCVLPEPSLRGYELPDPVSPNQGSDIAAALSKSGDGYRVFAIGFSLYERAWTLRGMENLMMDFVEHPQFIGELLNKLAEHSIVRLRQACAHDFDAVYFGDDWGQQQGLQMGPAMWREIILPVLRRMYGAVLEQGKKVFIHSCGDVDEVFDDLVDAGLTCFNPFQPEVMDVFALMRQYRGKLAFHGGLSTQRTLPFGTTADVRREVEKLLQAGRDGGLILSPAHAVEGDVPLENMLAMIQVLQGQEGAVGLCR